MVQRSSATSRGTATSSEIFSPFRHSFYACACLLGEMALCVNLQSRIPFSCIQNGLKGMNKQKQKKLFLHKCFTENTTNR